MRLAMLEFALKRRAPLELPTRTLSLSHNIVRDDKLDNQPPLLIMHGLLGNKKNFTFAGRLMQSLLPDRAIISCDVRNHGASPHSDVMDYPSMREDILELLSKLGIGKCVLMGHSLGGRIAMHVALVNPDKVDKLVVVDVAPGRKGERRSVSWSAYDYIEAMKYVKFEHGQSRGEAKASANKQLESSIPDKSIRDFVLTNLIQKPSGGYGWRVNIDAILNSKYSLSHIGADDSFVPYNRKTLFIAGELSDYIVPDDIPEIRRLFPTSTIEYMPGCGHWVHADNPRLFADAVSKFVLVP